MLSTLETMQRPATPIAMGSRPLAAMPRSATPSASNKGPANRILAALPAATLDRIAANLIPISLAVGETLYEVGRKSHHVYFPTSAVVSVMCDTADGATTEVCAVGSDGVLGFAEVLGGDTTVHRAVVLRAGHAYRLDAQLLKRESGLSGVLLQALLRCSLVMITQAAQTAVCIRHHSMEQQLCRRLLQLRDHSRSSEFGMTHETIASLLGVRRETITSAAGKLQMDGCIKYSRGRIEILDRCKLEARACECYRVIKDATVDLMGVEAPADALAA